MTDNLSKPSLPQDGVDLDEALETLVSEVEKVLENGGREGLNGRELEVIALFEKHLTMHPQVESTALGKRARGLIDPLTHLALMRNSGERTKMNASIPEVSIIVPTYRRPEKLQRTLDSIRSACSGSYEVIVVDDCPDGSAFRLAVEFGARYLCKAGADRGLSQSRNLGIRLARAERLVFIDDDDFFLPGGVDSLYRALLSGSSFAFGSYVRILPNRQVRLDLSQVTHERMLVANQIPVGAFMITRASIRRDFDERMRSHEDWDFLLGNVDWSRCKFAHADVVAIDKTEVTDESMQIRRRAYFGLDYLTVYSRYPAPTLSGDRQKALANLGLTVDESMLEQDDVI